MKNQLFEVLEKHESEVNSRDAIILRLSSWKAVSTLPLVTPIVDARILAAIMCHDSTIRNLLLPPVDAIRFLHLANDACQNLPLHLKVDPLSVKINATLDDQPGARSSTDADEDEDGTDDDGGDAR